MRGARGQNETDGVAKLFHLMQSAAFPLGAVRVSEPGHVTERDEGVVPFDYTLYTVVLCAQSLRCYWTSYENQRVQYLELERLLERSEPVQFVFGGNRTFCAGMRDKKGRRRRCGTTPAPFLLVWF